MSPPHKSSGLFASPEHERDVEVRSGCMIHFIFDEGRVLAKQSPHRLLILLAKCDEIYGEEYHGPCEDDD